MRSSLVTLAMVLGAASGCSDNSGSEVGGGGSGSGATSNAGGTSSGGGSAGSSSAGSGGAGIAVGGSLVLGGTGPGIGGSGNGTPETCDGIDNDANGVIDDVDAGGDGVCDCLNIATIGAIGPWSNGGNVFAAWLDARSPIGAAELGDQVLTPELLAPYQVIVVLHTATFAVMNDTQQTMSPANHAFSDTEASAFDAWVRAGGGAMTTIGYSNDEQQEILNVNKLLSPLGMAYSSTHLTLNGFVGQWDMHPVTEGVSNIRTDNGVEPEGTATGMATVAHGPAGEIALQVTEAGSGRVVVWGDEWITYDSEWADTTGQQVELFWLNILKWLSPPDKCQVPIPPRVK